MCDQHTLITNPNINITTTTTTTSNNANNKQPPTTSTNNHNNHHVCSTSGFLQRLRPLAGPL